MLILGIESSCDETSAAVVRDGREVLSCTVASQIAVHRLYGGVVPEIASRCHVEVISDVCRAALDEAGIGLPEIDAVAVTYTPGLIGALLVGVNFAKGLAYAADKPLVPVNHIKGHIAALYLTHPELEPPFVALVASGGHSTLVSVKSFTEMSVLGRAVDDAAGEAFDKVARVMGLPYPGGPEISRLAETGNIHGYRLPVPHTENPLDVSFSGLKTAVINIVNSAGMKNEPINKNDLAASFEWRANDILSDRLSAAAGKKAALGGGVAQNKLLRRLCEKKCREKGAQLFLPEPKYCGDNAAMIAAAGYYEYIAGARGSLSLNASAVSEL